MKNRKQILLLVSSALMTIYTLCAQNTEYQYLGFNPGKTSGNEEWVQTIQILEPACRSEVSGMITVKFKAPEMTEAKAMCWSQPTDEFPDHWGHDVNLTPKGIKLSKDATGSFKVDVTKFPAGPMNIRIYVHNREGKKDFFELQLYNRGGVKWNQGIPATDPPGARDLKLVFADDFDGPLSISNDGRNARYSAHKPRFGDFSGWPFSDVDGEDNPFEQVDTYLKIKARKSEGTNGSTGLIASVNMDGEGFWVKAPCYLECRFTAQSAPGTWPAFWTLTKLDRNIPGDELDIVEAYGGVGKGNPNHEGYEVVSHFWRQIDETGNRKKEYHKRVPILDLGGRSYWSHTFHTYAVYIGLDETVYYFDNIEVLRHPTNDESRNFPHMFLINYAIGGISRWPVDLERYENGSDMYIDYVRVYAKEYLQKYSIPPPCLPAKKEVEGVDEKPVKDLTRLPVNNNKEITGRDWYISQTFTDEFDGPVLDREKWINTHHYWKGRQPSIFEDNNVRVDTDRKELILRTDWTDEPTEKMIHSNAGNTNLDRQYRNYRAAAVSSMKKTGYGYYEIKARTAPVSITSSWWLQCNDATIEIDIFEQIGRPKKTWDPNGATISVGGFIYPNQKWTFLGRKDINTEIDLTAGYHIYGFEWGPHYVRAYLDGNIYWEMENKWFFEPMWMFFDMETFIWQGYAEKEDFIYFTDPLTGETRFTGDYCVQYMRKWISETPQYPGPLMK